MITAFALNYYLNILLEHYIERYLLRPAPLFNIPVQVNTEGRQGGIWSARDRPGLSCSLQVAAIMINTKRSLPLAGFCFVASALLIACLLMKTVTILLVSIPKFRARHFYLIIKNTRNALDQTTLHLVSF